MDVQKKIDEIVQAVGSARSMPMSASCVVNRADLLSMLEEVRQALPGSLAQAQELIGGREQLVEQARQEAERIIEGAHAERGSLISDTEVARRSQAEADRILAEARQAAEEVRAEADDYVDSKLANFEVVLTKTLGSVGRGREKLLGTGPGVDERGYEDEDAPERSHDPETLRRDADAYVDAKLGSFEAVLAKTLEAVGKGRRTLHGHAPADELGTLGEGGGSSDPLIEKSPNLGAGLDWKTSLQELTATEGLGVPEYLVTESGPDHEKTFTAAARVGGVSYGTGTGRSKKEAEQQAAESAWRAIRAAADERLKAAEAVAVAAETVGGGAEAPSA
ncbi:Ribonuclease 3 [Streptomyces alboniger]